MADTEGSRGYVFAVPVVSILVLLIVNAAEDKEPSASYKYSVIGAWTLGTFLVLYLAPRVWSSWQEWRARAHTRRVEKRTRPLAAELAAKDAQLQTEANIHALEADAAQARHDADIAQREVFHAAELALEKDATRRLQERRLLLEAIVTELDGHLDRVRDFANRASIDADWHGQGWNNVGAIPSEEVLRQLAAYSGLTPLHKATTEVTNRLHDIERRSTFQTGTISQFNDAYIESLPEFFGQLVRDVDKAKGLLASAFDDVTDFDFPKLDP